MGLSMVAMVLSAIKETQRFLAVGVAMKYLVDYMFDYMFAKLFLAMALAVITGFSDPDIINQNDDWLIFIAGCIAHYMSRK